MIITARGKDKTAWYLPIYLLIRLEDQMKRICSDGKTWKTPQCPERNAVFTVHLTSNRM